MDRWLPILIVIILLGCNEKTVEKPENLIAKEQMADILYDLAIINAAKKINPNYLIERNIESMPFIFKKYGIDSAQFSRSDIYYASIPEEYEAIYKNVEARLEKEKSEFDEIKSKVSDSVKRAADRQRELLRQQSAKRKEKDTLP